jgi:hypothetical protein
VGRRGRSIEPLRVINDTCERLLVGRLGKQAEDRQSDQERIGRRPCTQSECDAKRLVLGLRETIQEVKELGTQLLKRRERELHLRIDARRPGDPKPARSLNCVLEQRGLSDARFAMHHQHNTTPAARGVQQPVEYLALALPAEQPTSWPENPWRRPAHPA